MEAIEQWSQLGRSDPSGSPAGPPVAASGKDSVETLRHRLEAMKLSPSARDTADVMLIFVRLHATAVRRPGELPIASTEILELLFGELKTLESSRPEAA